MSKMAELDVILQNIVEILAPLTKIEKLVVIQAVLDEMENM